MSDASGWNFVPRSKYAPPGFSTEAIRSLHGAWKAARKKIAAWRADSDLPASELDLPTQLPQDMLPEPDLDAAAGHLIESFTRRFERQEERHRPFVVIGSPGAYTAQIVSAVAQARDCSELEAPSRTNLLSDPAALDPSLERLREPSDTPVLIGRLESWFLRHEIALTGIRELVQALGTGSRPILIGCSSWTWAYLDRALGIEAALGEPLVLAPFDGDLLDQWLGASFRSQKLVCLKAGSQDEVFPAAAGEDARRSSLIDQIASAARGNPGVALAIWKRSLREGNAQEDRQPGAARNSWWAVTPDEAELDLPPGADEVDRFVLHASLLHGGLEAELWNEVLPFPDHEVERRVKRLSSAGVLVEDQSGFRVSEAAYIPVRNSLATRGFLVDAL